MCQVLEERFAEFDQDGAGTLTFNELRSNLALLGFSDGDKLYQDFKQVDRDRNNTLDFSEYLALMYLFSSQDGSLVMIFKDPVNAEHIKNSFHLMARYLGHYDRDRNARLSVQEVSTAFIITREDIICVDSDCSFAP